MAPDPRQRLGLAGEEAAARTLDAAGLRVLERRYRTRLGEIDIVAECGALLVFVEVKTRQAGTGMRPAEAVTAVKRQRMARVAGAYLAERRWLDRPCRFDVVEVLVDERGALRARHLADAFRLSPTG